MATSRDMELFMQGYCTALGEGYTWTIELTSSPTKEERKKYKVDVDAWQVAWSVGSPYPPNPYPEYPIRPHSKYTLIILNKEGHLFYISAEQKGYRKNGFPIGGLIWFVRNPKVEIK